MAIKYAITNGNWSNPAIWNDGSLPSESDVVYSNNKTITIDVNPLIVKELRNDSNTGILGGGSFTVPVATQSFVLTADLYAYAQTVLSLNSQINFDTITINGDSKTLQQNTVVYPIQATINNATTLIINGNLYNSLGLGSWNDGNKIYIVVKGNWFVPENYELYHTTRINYYISQGLFIEISGNLTYNGVAAPIYWSNQLVAPMFLKCKEAFFNKNILTRNPVFNNGVYTTGYVIRIDCETMYLGENVTKPNAVLNYNDYYAIENGIQNHYILYPSAFNYPSSNNVLGGVTYGKDNEYIGTAIAVNLTEQQLQRVGNCATVSTVQKCFEEFKEE